MLIVFDKLFLDCVHDPILHNRLQTTKLRGLLSVLLTSLSEHNDKPFKEIKKTRNCHFVNYPTGKKITEIFEKYAKRNEVKLFVSYANLYQIAIPNSEVRLIGDLKTNYFHSKEKSYDDLFSVLFVDFEHSLHKNIRRVKQSELICVMKEKDC